MKKSARVALPLMLLLSAFCMQTARAQSGCVVDRNGKSHCAPPGGGCVLDGLNNVKCSGPDGGILLNRFQEAVCGPGQCASDGLGEISCSSQPRGYAVADQLGKVVCTGGCVPASAAACNSLK